MESSVGISSIPLARTYRALLILELQLFLSSMIFLFPVEKTLKIWYIVLENLYSCYFTVYEEVHNIKCKYFDSCVFIVLSLWTQGTDPPTYDLIQKNQVLQKRLLAISETISERDAQLQDSQNLCKNLKDRLSRQPGPDVALRLQEAQHAVRKKEKKIKVCYSYCSEYQLKKLVERGAAGIFQLLVNM